jgi:hypothetical protein
VKGYPIKKHAGLWTVTVDGIAYRNSRLGDLKAQVSRLIG